MSLELCETVMALVHIQSQVCIALQEQSGLLRSLLALRHMQIIGIRVYCENP